MTIPVAWLNAPIQQVDVWTEHLGPPILAGRLNYERAIGVAYFEWSEDARLQNLDLSPLHLPLGTGVWASHRERELPGEYHGLPGFLNDALPDGWGLYLMNKALARAGIPPELITPATRLAFLGDRAWGSLSFQPVIEEDIGAVMSLDELGREMEATIEGHIDAVSDGLLQAGSSPQGARPKVMVDCDPAFRYARVTAGVPAEGFRSWLIKFAARDEPEDAPLVEQAYMLSARNAGLRVMGSGVLNLRGKHAFATERFDRNPTGRVFTHTLGGLLHFSHRAIGLDYANVAQAMEALQVPEPAFQEAYARTVFNAAMSVRDDHAKNFAFVKGLDNRWDISPAYDLTYMPGPGGYHTMTFAGGTSADPTRQDLLNLAPHYHLDGAQARPIIQAMAEVARQVVPMAREMGVSQATLAPIEQRLNAINSSIEPRTSRARGR
ncbi:MAG TPA: type II toxin-antitoxin system HipA family toxin [Luteibacter sp.]|jgi:serine/threonine-protein kinase HipA|nr:type II toxin-antitoxin system HipA family toxin [Luteibacter sp.]